MMPRLRTFELAWTDATFDAIHPAESPLPHGIGDMKPSRFLDDVIRTVPFEQSFGLRFTLWVVALSPLFTIMKLGTIASIAPRDRVRVLERLVASPIYLVRQLVQGLKAVASLLYGQSPAIREALTISRAAHPSGLVALGRKKLEANHEGGRDDHAAA
ncbi:MAG: hypothetical protein KF819_37410 [Labilithrix sp.]|nr:hypothetical protein [Labilithrix sp.]